MSGPFITKVQALTCLSQPEAITVLQLPSEVIFRITEVIKYHLFKKAGNYRIHFGKIPSKICMFLNLVFTGTIFHYLKNSLWKAFN